MLAPTTIPMLAQLEPQLPRGDRWAYEPKFDGFRGRLWRRGDAATGRSSGGGRRFDTEAHTTVSVYQCISVSAQIAVDHDRIFGALSDATRRDIVRRAIDGEEGVAELAAHYPMSFAAVQKHVAMLERAGLVSKHRIGRRKVVRTNVEGLRVARRLLDRYEDLWRERVERMNQLISESPKEADR